MIWYCFFLKISFIYTVITEIRTERALDRISLHYIDRDCIHITGCHSSQHVFLWLTISMFNDTNVKWYQCSLTLIFCPKCSLERYLSVSNIYRNKQTLQYELTLKLLETQLIHRLSSPQRQIGNKSLTVRYVELTLNLLSGEIHIHSIYLNTSCLLISDKIMT